MNSSLATRKVRPEFIIGFALVLLVWGVFGQSMLFDFVAWDDDQLIYRNPHFGGITWERLCWMFGSLNFVWRYLPLTWLGWSINYDLGGLDPLGYHAGNLLLHTANVLLVFVVIRKIIRWRFHDAPASSINVPAAVAAAIWGVHPLRAEPVAWATDRVYCQSLFFLLMAFWCYLAWRARATADLNAAKANCRLYWLGVVLFAASLFSYQSGLCYAAVLVVLDFWPVRRFNEGLRGLFDGKAWRIWLEKVPYGLVAVLVASVALLARFSDASKPALEGKLTLLQHLTQACYVLGYYVWKPVVPTNLSPFYNTLLTINPTEARFALSIAAVIVITALLWWRRHKWPGLLAAWTCHVALLLPVAGFTEYPHYTSDRYSYFAAVCSCCVVAALLVRCDAIKVWRSLARLGAFAVVLTLAVSAHQQTRIWANSVTLLEHILDELKGTPAPPGVHWRLANAQAHGGQAELALGALRQFIVNSPDRTGAMAKSANALFTHNLFGDSQRLYAAVVATRPNDAELRNDYGVALAASGKSEEGMAQFDQAARLRPELASPWQNMGMALSKQGKTNEAKPFLERARSLGAASR